MGKLFIMEHPLIKNKIAMLRNRDTGGKEFRELAEEVAMLMCYEATRDIATSKTEIDTPLERTTCEMISNKGFVFVSILRAGIGMTEGMLNLIPTAKVGHVGIYRDPLTLLPVEYYCKLPGGLKDMDVLVIDPMLATGGTASATINFLKERGAENIKFLCLLSSPEGVARLNKDHPDVNIYTGAHDRALNEQGYIVPGLGDAGDRLFGTK